MQPALVLLQQRLQHTYSRPALLTRALTHRSASADHNERLEFLGDSVLSLAVSSLLYERLPDLAEGELSRVRANLVKQDSLHRLALTLDLPAVLRVGEGEARSGGKTRPSMLADALEALIGAVYLDAGFEAAERVVRRLFEGVEIGPQMQAAARDAKTALQEWLQGRRLQLPAYRVVETSGVAHRQSFEVECTVAERALAVRGSGNSRRAAEQSAAAAMLAQLQAQTP
ncbi:MAG: ribonuclease III [Acidovorax sp. SCN 68-22]|nr:ribonuclease III [Simplicispira sp.]ODS70184.1 MAG: ribonuclease III [Acidovorax sp. SCN 68-22]